MFVHAGASLHGHELSSPKRDASPSRGNHYQQQPTNSLLRSALRPRPPLGDTTNSASSVASNNSKHARFSLTSSSPSSDFAPGRRSYTEPVLSTSASPSSPSALPLASPSSLPPTSPLLPRIRRPVSDIVTKKDLAVRFQEPTAAMASRASIAPSITTLPSEDEESIAGSDVSDYTIDSSTRRKRRKRSPRLATHYSLAHPPPRRRTKQRSLIQFRPSTLLQLQRLDARRPIPAFDVLPSSTVSTTFLLPRLAQRFPRVLRAKPELGPDDLVVVKSEDYESGSSGGHTKLEQRDLMGVVSPLPEFGDNAAEIIMGDGSIWSTTLLPNGSYEFNCIDSHGITTTARWVRKAIGTDSRRWSDVPPSPDSTSPEYRWTFSIIDPSTKRHPIMGVLTSHELLTYDTYSTMSASCGRFPPTKPFTNIAASGEPSTPTKSERSTYSVPDEYKQFMIVTASWISLRLKGWPDFANPKNHRRNSMHCRTASTTSASITERRRTFPFHTNNPADNVSPGPCTPRVSDDERPSQERLPHPDIPKRHMSTGAAYMRRRRMETESLEEVKKENLRLEKGEGLLKPVIGTRGLGSEDERTVTCRIKVRRLTQRLFHREGRRKGVA